MPCNLSRFPSLMLQRADQRCLVEEAGKAGEESEEEEEDGRTLQRQQIVIDRDVRGQGYKVDGAAVNNQRPRPPLLPLTD
jgi:hypothetical protein